MGGGTGLVHSSPGIIDSSFTQFTFFFYLLDPFNVHVLSCSRLVCCLFAWGYTKLDVQFGFILVVGQVYQRVLYLLGVGAGSHKVA